MHSHYTLEPPVFMDKYHAEVVKEKLTRKLPAILPSTIDEVAVSVKEHIIANESGMHYGDALSIRLENVHATVLQNGPVWRFCPCYRKSSLVPAIEHSLASPCVSISSRYCRAYHNFLNLKFDA